jgi:hypothetical protein
MRVNTRALCPALARRYGFRFGARSMKRMHVPLDQPSPVEQLLARLLARALKAFPEPHYKQPLLGAAREAVAQAEATGWALLMLPELFAELALAAVAKAEYFRQGQF